MIMKYQLKVVLLSMLLLLNYNVQAYELRDAIKDAAHHNQELHKLKEDLAIITLTKAKAATEFLPDVNAEWSKKNNGEGRSNLMIKQEIYAGGKSIARIASANARIASANQEYKEKVNNIIYDVISTYQSILTIRDKIKVMKNDVVVAKKHLDKANINVDAGAYTKSESFLAKAYLSEQESALEESKDQLVMQEAKFKYHTGKNPPKDFRSIDLKKYDKIINKSQDIQTFVALNNRVVRAKSEVEESKQNVNISVSNVLPKVVFSASKGEAIEKDAIGNTTSFKGQKHSIEISSPVFNAENYVDISKARKYKELKRSELNDTTKSVRNDLNNAWIEYKAAQNIFNLSKIAEEYHYKTLLSAEEEVKSGSKSITDIIKIQRSYNKFAIDRLEKEERMSLSIFKIYKIIGDLTTIII